MIPALSGWITMAVSCAAATVPPSAQRTTSTRARIGNILVGGAGARCTGCAVSRSGSRSTAASDDAGEGPAGRVIPPRSAAARARAGAYGDTGSRGPWRDDTRSEEHTSELQSQSNLRWRLLLVKKKPIPRPRDQ